MADNRYTMPAPASSPPPAPPTFAFADGAPEGTAPATDNGPPPDTVAPGNQSHGIDPIVLQQIAFTRWLAVGSLMSLIALGVVWELFWAPLRPGGSSLVFKVLPLFIPLAGLLKNRMYTYRWVSLLVWLYFTEGVVRAWSDRKPSAYLAMLEIFLCLLLFTACALHIRIRLRTARGAKGTTPTTYADESLKSPP